MDPKLQRQITQLESSKNLLLEKLEKIAPSRLVQKPDDKSWSIIQVVSHMIKVEQGSMNYMKKKLSYNPPLKKTGTLTAVKIGLTNLVMKLPFRFKTTDFLEEPTNSISFEQVKSQWAETRTQMRGFLEGLSQEQLSAALHKNLLAGRVNVYQQLSFIQVHFDRHVRQIDRIIQQNG